MEEHRITSVNREVEASQREQKSQGSLLLLQERHELGTVPMVINTQRTTAALPPLSLSLFLATKKKSANSFVYYAVNSINSIMMTRKPQVVKLHTHTLTSHNTTHRHMRTHTNVCGEKLSLRSIHTQHTLESRDNKNFKKGKAFFF